MSVVARSLELLFSEEALALRAVAIGVALVLDLMLGDPPTRVHPVAWLGRSIAWLEHRLRSTRLGERPAGTVLVLAVTVTSAGTALGFSLAAHAVGPAAAVAVDAVLLWLALASRSLADEGAAVSKLLRAGDIAAARTRVGRIVARSTAALDERGVARACVESLGENVVDAVIAPLVWGALLGPAGVWLHKSASTLDSMVGYRTERYERFGAAAARLDDVLAWLPARLALGVVPLAAATIGAAPFRAVRVGVRDRLLHESPNSAHGEAAFAGALGVSLGGRVVYADRQSERPLIGAEFGHAEGDDCKRAAALVMATSVITSTVLACALLGLACLS